MGKTKLSVFLGSVLLSGCMASANLEMSEEQAAEKYTQVFASGNLDENFRSLFTQYAAIEIENSAEVYTLPFSLRTDALPETFLYGEEEKNLKDFLKSTHTTGLMILYKGKVIYEDYARGNVRDDHVMLMSVSKTMTSFLIGVAANDGLLALDEPMTKYVPSLHGTGYDGVTIKNALEMSSGIKWDEGFGRPDSDLARSMIAMTIGSLDAFALTLERDNAPGTYNRYVSMDTHVLGMVLRGATGVPYEAYFHDKLWSKLGAESSVKMLVDTKGQPLVYGGVNIRLRDMLRFGKLYLDEGRNYKGEQIVPSQWVRESTRPDVARLMPMANNPDSDSGFGYKYQWWTPYKPDGLDFSAIGIYGQFIYVNPERDVVIVKSSAYPDYTKDGGPMNNKTFFAFQAIAKHLTPDADVQDLKE